MKIYKYRFPLLCLTLNAAIGSKYIIRILPCPNDCFNHLEKLNEVKQASCWLHLGKRGYDVSVLSLKQQLCLNKQAETEPLPKNKKTTYTYS